jgi:hypothetical protein
MRKPIAAATSGRTTRCHEQPDDTGQNTEDDAQSDQTEHGERPISEYYAEHAALSRTLKGQQSPSGRTPRAGKFH